MIMKDEKRQNALDHCSRAVMCKSRLGLADVFLCLQAEPDGFAMFHLYVCAAFLTKFSLDLQHEKDFQVQYTHVQHFDWTNVLKNVGF